VARAIPEAVAPESDSTQIAMSERVDGKQRSNTYLLLWKWKPSGASGADTRDRRRANSRAMCGPPPLDAAGSPVRRRTDERRMGVPSPMGLHSKIRSIG
jgi:hypothetical protein